MKQKAFIISTLLVLGLLIPNLTFAALLEGNTVEYQYFFPNLSSPYGGADNGNKLVGAGVEVSNVADNRATMDISDTNLYIDYLNSSSWNPATFNGFRIKDINGTISSFTSVVMNNATNMSGFSNSNISFDADNIWVNWTGLSFDANTVVSIDINGGGNVVPEPASMLLLGSGLLGLVGFKKKNK